MGNKHIGSSFDDFLKEQGLYEKVTTVARSRVEEWQRNNQPRHTKDNDNGCSIRNGNHREVE
jgi:hypothetical protein